VSHAWADIVHIVWSRRAEQTALVRRMLEVRDRYNGDYVVPLPVEGDDVPLPPMTAQIIADAIDHTAMRAGSVMPTITSPALDPAKVRGTRSSEYANIRKRALGYTYAESNLPILLRRAFRQLAGYGTCSMLAVPNERVSEPRIVLRDPLSTFPEPRDSGDLDPVSNCAFVHGKSATWLVANYPKLRDVVGKRPAEHLWDVVEWVDDDEVVLGLLGPRADTQVTSGLDQPANLHMELSRFPNKAGMCPAVVGNRVTLDRLSNQIANIVGQTDMMARLQALEIRGVERSIWPDTYLVGIPGEAPVLLGGAWKEGTTGEVNLLSGVAEVGQLRGTPDPRAAQTIDRLERNARVSSGLVPAMGGETYGALRTGRGMDTMMAAAVDPRVQELQEIMQMLLVDLNAIVLGTYEGYWGGRTYVGFSRWPSDRTSVEFVPSKHFETHASGVTYPIPGADVQSTTVMLGQLYGTKAISLQTFRAQHPYVADADAEAAQTRIEAIDDAIFASLLQRFSEGGIPPVDQAAIKRAVAKGVPIEDAIDAVDKAAKERQATEAPDLGKPGAPALDPTTGAPMPGSEAASGAPGAMPGLANPGEGAESLPPPGAGTTGVSTPEDLESFRQLSRALSTQPTPGQGAPV
jgi:hypothetical protein